MLSEQEQEQEQLQIKIQVLDNVLGASKIAESEDFTF